MHRPPRLHGLLIAATVFGSGLAAHAAVSTLAPWGIGAQIEAGSLATWDDLSTWTRPSAATPALIETGVGFVLRGDSGPMRLAFYVVRPARGGAATRPPAQIGVRAAAGSRMNPNLMRTPTLTFTYGSPETDAETIDLSSVMTVDNPAPGAAVESGVAMMPADAFLEMLQAPELAADVFGATVTFREDQIDALRAFRDRVFPQRTISTMQGMQHR